MKMKKHIAFAVAAILLLAAGNLTAAQTARSAKAAKKANASKKTRLILRAGLNMFQSSGSDGDYVAGANDFPSTPAYQAPALGIGLAFPSSKSLAFGVNVSYGLSAQVDLRDPSDNETIQAEPPKSLLAVLNVAKTIDLSRQMQLLVSLGAGGEYRMGGEQEFVSSLGNRIVLAAPEKPFAPLAALAAGLHYMIADSLGLALDVQGTYIFRDPSQLLITPSLGLILKL
jgi:hypothetical protein